MLIKLFFHLDKEPRTKVERINVIQIIGKPMVVFGRCIGIYDLVSRWKHVVEMLIE